MDFLKSLMLYMALTFATSVQTAPAPEETPVPTAVPTAIVTAVTPAEDTAATPAPSAAVTLPGAAAQVTKAPVPTITPNNAYRNLKQGDRGDRVKKLQERLIELGYLGGTADGVFGRQTYSAVLAFQKRNGLSRDGVAGDMTQTYLFENPDVIAAEATPTPAPTDTPAPEATLGLPAADLPAMDSAKPDASAPQALAQANIVVNGSGTPLSCLRQEDGVTVASKPRLWQSDGLLLISLADLVSAMPDWALAEADGTLTLTAAGYVAVLTAADGGYTCAVDGKDIALADEDLCLVDGAAAVTPAFLEQAFSAQTEWDEEEQTLLITLQDKSIAQATD